MIPHVLVVSRDEMLLHTRQLILGAFFQVKGAGRVRDAEKLISGCHFDLIVLCYTLAESECRSVLEMVANQCPRPKILMLSTGIEPNHSLYDQAVMTDAGPYYLLKKSAELLGVEIKPKPNLVEV